MRTTPTGLRAHLGPFVSLLASGFAMLTAAQPAPLSIRFIDSATGYAVQPDAVIIGPDRAATEQFNSSQIHSSGRLSVQLNRGLHRIQAQDSSHQPMFGDFELGENNPFKLQFLLDPLEQPAEFGQDYIAALQRPEATLFLGFVVDDESGQPLSGVRVGSAADQAETTTDARGYFQIHVPLSIQPQTGLSFSKAGYQTEQRQHLELWPNGSWIYRVRLLRGHGSQLVDERQFRRRTENSSASATSADNSPVSAQEIQPLDVPGPLATSPTNSTVRVPRNIRVLRADGVTIDYVTLTYYARSVLPSEWIPSWANITGGSNSLNAGAVAVRCYAIAKLNNTSTNYDICATTSCQVYNPANINPLTDTAVNFTANWVLLGGNGNIASTEYSAENNSITLACGDGFTAPTGSCLYDPVCAGQARNGHGRGMCQWGSAKWATGRKFTGNSTGNATLNGYPRRDWMWILQHYYPTLALVKGAPLIVGDDVKARSTVNVRACADGSITNGVNCPSITSKAAGATGLIVDGPVQVTNDNGGYTWYQIQWNDPANTVGWSVENFIERVFSLPSSPASLVATAVGSNQINLSWTDTSAGAAALFKVERAISATGPWVQLSNVVASVTNFSDKNLYPASTWSYRVRAYNAGGNSGYSAVASSTTSNSPPVFSATPNPTISEESTLTFSNALVNPDFVKLITDFEPFMTETANGLVMFRDPRFSTTTVGFLDAAPNLSAITDVFSTNGNLSTRALRIQGSFTNNNSWLRLTTAGAANFPNPVIDFTKKLRLNVYADKPIQIAVGCRETSTAGTAAIGSDGGTAGASIEWAGVTNVASGIPMPTRTVGASNWTTVTFDFPSEPVRSFSGGNGILSTASGLGVLEHLAIVPAAGTGVYNIYLDNIAVLIPKTLSYSLAAGGPTNATIHPITGVFSWTPLEWQGPATNSVAVRVTDNTSPPLSTTNLVTIIVLESNRSPVVIAVSNRIVHAGATVTVTNQATDEDLPVNTLTFSLGTNTPAGASIHPATGLFSWTTSNAESGTTVFIPVRVTDNGSPPLSDEKVFSITILPKPTLAAVSNPAQELILNWSAIAGGNYRVQFKNDLGDSNWLDLVPDVTADGSTGTITLSMDAAQRFYRVLVVE